MAGKLIHTNRTPQAFLIAGKLIHTNRTPQAFLIAGKLIHTNRTPFGGLCCAVEKERDRSVIKKGDSNLKRRLKGDDKTRIKTEKRGWIKVEDWSLRLLMPCCHFMVKHGLKSQVGVSFTVRDIQHSLKRLSWTNQSKSNQSTIS